MCGLTIGRVVKGVFYWKLHYNNVTKFGTRYAEQSVYRFSSYRAVSIPTGL